MTFPGKKFKLLRRRCESIARRLPMPWPYDARRLCELVSAGRGRPILLLELPGEEEMAGAWLATDDTDLIFYRPHTTPPHQDHIILHELSHVICGHYPAPKLTDQRHLLFPDLSPALVGRVLSRTTYWSQEEQEAELLASLIWRRACGRSRPRTALRRVDAVLAWPGDDVLAARGQGRG
jgi:hypothetical protein